MFGKLFGNNKRRATGTPMDMSPTAQILPGDRPDMAPKQRGMDEKLYALGGLIANLGGVPNNAAGEYMSSRRAQQDNERKAAAQQQQLQATVAALVQQGVPPQQAQVIAQGGAGDSLLAKHYEPQSNSPTSLQQNYEWLVSQGRKEEAESLLKRSTDDAVWKQGPDGQWYRVQPSQPPTVPVGKLRPLGEGGPTPQASGSFLR